MPRCIRPKNRATNNDAFGTITIRPSHPFGDSKGALLVGRSPFARESPAPKRRVDLGDHPVIGWNAPTIEGPEMHAVFGV